ncbi:MAG: peptide chain release factor N(5)-glutamine methyltransferase [candidate division WOR-3 bacterium]
MLRELSKIYSLPYEDVENLFLYHYKIPRYHLYLSPHLFPLTEELSFLLKKRQEGYPIQYLTKTAFFLDYQLYVDERVFIPRPETEGLVMLVERELGKEEIEKILEIGTGSGNLAIGLARIFPKAKIFATDISEEALAVAEINIRRYNLGKRIRLIKSNLFTTSEIRNCSFDFIVSNPPYIPSEEICRLAREVRDFEPRIALDGGEDGFFYIERIIEEGRRFLRRKGRIFLEIDPRHKEKILALGVNGNFYRDLAGHIRYAVIS